MKLLIFFELTLIFIQLDTHVLNLFSFFNVTLTTMECCDNHKNFIKSSIWMIINIFSICFVFWKSSECVNKYLEKPKGTTLSIETTDTHQFPAITICPSPLDDPYNDLHLKKCGINGYIKDHTRSCKGHYGFPSGREVRCGNQGLIGICCEDWVVDHVGLHGGR